MHYCRDSTSADRHSQQMPKNRLLMPHCHIFSKGARTHTHGTILPITNRREITTLLMPDTHITESQNSDVKSERNRRLQQWQLKWACSHFCDVNELPRDHTAKTRNVETHLKTSHLQWSYNYFSWQDCSALSLLPVRNTKLFRTHSVLPKTGRQRRDSNEGTKGKTTLMADVLRQDGRKGVFGVLHPSSHSISSWGTEENESARTAKQFGQLLSFYWELDSLFSSQRNESQGELWIRHAPSNLQCPVLSLKSSRCTVCIN